MLTISVVRPQNVPSNFEPYHIAQICKVFGNTTMCIVRHKMYQTILYHTKQYLSGRNLHAVQNVSNFAGIKARRVQLYQMYCPGCVNIPMKLFHSLTCVAPECKTKIPLVTTTSPFPIYLTQSKVMENIHSNTCTRY